MRRGQNLTGGIKKRHMMAQPVISLGTQASFNEWISFSFSLHTVLRHNLHIMASPRLETFCCPNRDASTEFVVTFQPLFFGAICIGSAAVSLIFSIIQILPKRRGYRRLGQYPLPKPASSSRILFIISVCDILGCAGKVHFLFLILCYRAV